MKSLLIASLLATATTVFASDHPAVPRKSPDEVINTLKEGNARFISGRALHPNQNADRRVNTATKGQNPSVIVLSCSDSRQVPELIFDAGIGDLFVMRVAGNVSSDYQIASAEYAALHLNVPLILVLGHTKCGAVTAASKGVALEGKLNHLMACIEPACARAKASGAADVVEASIRENVWQAIYDLYIGSAELRELARLGKVKTVGAVYDIQSGNVDWMGSHPQEKSLLAIPSPVVMPAPKQAEGHAEKEESHTPAPAPAAHGH